MLSIRAYPSGQFNFCDDFEYDLTTLHNLKFNLYHTSISNSDFILTNSLVKLYDVSSINTSSFNPQLNVTDIYPISRSTSFTSFHSSTITLSNLTNISSIVNGSHIDISNVSDLHHISDCSGVSTFKRRTNFTPDYSQPIALTPNSVSVNDINASSTTPNLFLRF